MDRGVMNHVRLLYTLEQAENLLGLPLGLISSLDEFPAPDNERNGVPLWAQATIEQWWMNRKGEVNDE